MSDEMEATPRSTRPSLSLPVVVILLLVAAVIAATVTWILSTSTVSAEQEFVSFVRSHQTSQQAAVASDDEIIKGGRRICDLMRTYNKTPADTIQVINSSDGFVRVLPSDEEEFSSSLMDLCGSAK